MRNCERMASYYAIYQAVAFTSHSPLPLLLPARNPATCRRKPRFLANIDADRPKIQVNNQAKSQKPNYEVSPKRVVFSAGNMPPIKGVFPPGRLPLAVELDYVLNHPVTDGIISFLVILNCLAFALQTIDVGPVLHQVFINYEHGVSALFAIEYFGRWYGKGLSRRFLLTRSMIIDFIAVSPTGFAVTDQSEALFVRLLRLSRIFRLQRMVMDSESSKDMMESMTNIQIRLANIGLSLFNLLYVSAGLFYQAEKDVNPAIRNFFDAFYFSSITLFTVGFGDVTPLTSLGRISAVLIPYQLSEVERVRELRSQQKSSEQQRTSPISGGSVRKADFDEQGSRRYVAPLVDLEKECKQCHLIGHQMDARFCRNCGSLLKKRRFD